MKDEILKRIGDANDGATVDEYTCPTHGRTWELTVSNEGGQNGTSTCLECAAELLSLLKAPAAASVVNEIIFRRDNFIAVIGLSAAVLARNTALAKSVHPGFNVYSENNQLICYVGNDRAEAERLAKRFGYVIVSTEQ